MDESARKVSFTNYWSKIDKAFCDAQLTVLRLERLLGTRAQKLPQTGWWSFDSRDGGFVIDVRAENENTSASEISAYLHVDVGLTIHDLEKIYGRWRLIGEGKQSRVTFPAKKGRSDGLVDVLAELLFPPSDETSPVLEITLRR
jgi:hypothetical protein